MPQGREVGGRLFIGTSGYVNPHWRGPFYPQTLPHRRGLRFYLEPFSSVELNSPFYGLPSPEIFAAWRESVPKGFVFAARPAGSSPT